MADPYSDEGALLSLVRRKVEEWSRGRENFIRAAWRNILFYRGHQWIVYNRLSNTWTPVRNTRNWPTPVTNLYASTMDAVTSVLARIEPVLNYAPATEEMVDRATADVGGRVIEVIQDEVDIRVHRQYLATFVGLTGGAWLETGYDPSPEHGTRFIPHEQCFSCGLVSPPAPEQTCPSCGNRLFGPALDASGTPVGEEVPVGKMYVDVVPVFEMFFDSSEPMWSKQKEYCRRKSVSVDEARQRWPDLGDRIQPNVMASEYAHYSESLHALGPKLDETGTGRGLWGTGQNTLSNTRVTEEWFWRMPDDTYPEGLQVIIVGKQHLAWAGPLQYTMLHEHGRRPFLPHVFFPQKLVPGSAWPKTVADDLALKAAQHNRLEAFIELSLMRTANPVWLLPEGCNVSNFTGEPGQRIRWNALGPNPAKPERIAGQGIASGVLAFYEQNRRFFEELAGTFEVIKGSRPQGVSAGITLQILREQGMNRFAPMFILWETAWAAWSRQAIEIFRQFATEPRVHRIQGRDGGWQVQKFMAADLQGRVNVIPEASSSMPRSSLLERAELEQLAAMGVVNPVADPEAKQKFLEAWGRPSLTPGMALEAKNAAMENEAFEALAQNPLVAQLQPQHLQALRMMPPEQAQAQLQQAGLAMPRIRPAVDDHGIHSREHRNFLRSETGKALPLPVQTLMEMHLAAHDQLAAAQMQAMIQARQGMNPMAGFLQPPPGGGGGSPMNEGSSMKRMMGDGREMVAAQAGAET